VGADRQPEMLSANPKKTAFILSHSAMLVATFGKNFMALTHQIWRNLS
jgi:hypothetical protein